jgi:hypothetical protein
MPATPAMIGFVSQEYRSVIVSDPDVRAVWGSAARDTSQQKDPTTGQPDTTAEEPTRTFFDLLSDAQAMANERLNLLKVGRRLFEVTYGELLDFQTTLAFTPALPTIRLIDPSKAADLDTLLVSVDAVDYETGRTTVQQWG